MRLFVLDFGLFEVFEDGRIIGIQGYLITTPKANVLVDTGFPAWYLPDPQLAGRREGLDTFGRLVRLFEENFPAGQLALAGLTLRDVTHLVLSHGDIDHVGSIGDFPQAELVVGRAERSLPHPRYFGDVRPVPWPDADLRLVDGDCELIPGVELLATPGHSPGHLSLLIRLPRTGPVVLACDAISRRAELESNRYGGVWDEEQARASAHRLVELAEREGAMLVFGHDPDQWPTLRKAPQFYD